MLKLEEFNVLRAGYEYWGDRLGEEEVEGAEPEDLKRLLKGLLASAPKGPICIFGHMHEPQKCHRLQLCNLLPAECLVQHLMWEDHRNVRVMGHEQADSLYNRWVEYFYNRRSMEEVKRQEERRRASEVPDTSAPTPAVSSGWGRAKALREKEEAAAARLARLAEMRAKDLPTLNWEEVRFRVEFRKEPVGVSQSSGYCTIFVVPK